MENVMGAIVQSFLIYGAIILVLLGIYFYWRSRKQQDKKLRKEKMPQVAHETAAMTANFPASDEFVMLDDGEIDALDLLFQARQEEPTTALNPAPLPDYDADEEEVDLASLLAGIADEPTPTVKTISEQALEVNLNTGQTAHAREVLSVLRDENDGRLIVLLDDMGYRTLVDSPAAKKKFSRLMKELAQVVTSPDGVVPAKPAASVPTEESADDDAEVDIPHAEGVEEIIKAAKGEIEEVPGDIPQMKIGAMDDSYEKGRFGRVKVKKVDKVEEVNIAEAIEAYLQHKISETPDFQRRGIHIWPALHGVRIDVDGKSYEGVDDVEDEDVKAFLKATIAEWQERQQRR